MAEDTILTQTTPSENGAFLQTLKRNNKQIRDDRARDIVESAETKYRRKIEDMSADIRKLKRERENMLDLSPTTATSLILASDFKEDEFVEKDIKIGLSIRELEITLDVATKRYTELFGG